MNQDDAINFIEDLQKRNLISESEHNDAISLIKNECVSQSSKDYLRGKIYLLHDNNKIDDDLFYYLMHLIKQEVNPSKETNNPSNSNILKNDKKCNSENAKVVNSNPSKSDFESSRLRINENNTLIKKMSQIQINYEFIIVMLLSYVLSFFVADEGVVFFKADNLAMGFERLFTMCGLIAIVIIGFINIRGKNPNAIIVQALLSGLLTLRYLFLFYYDLDSYWPSIIVILLSLISLGLSIYGQYVSNDHFKLASMIVFLIAITIAYSWRVGVTTQNVVTNKVDIFTDLTATKDLLFFGAMSLGLVIDYI